MKKAEIIFKVLGYTIILGGLALLIYYAVYPSELYKGTEYEYFSNSEKISGSNNYQMQEISKPAVKNPKRTIDYKRKKKQVVAASSLSGKWKVIYNTDDLKGAVVYTIKKEGDKYNAYTYELQDENGYGQKVPAEKTLSVKSFSGKSGKGIYKIDYEGKKYDVPCNINLIDTNTLTVSYDYYGYSDTEKWKRIE